MKLIIVFLFISVLVNLQASTQDFSKEIAAVKAGKIQEAKASWWGFNADNATKCLQDAIDSGVKKLTVDNMGSPWIVGPIKLRSNLELIFADGVNVKALKGDFKKRNASLFTAKKAHNIILRGEGKAVLEMNKTDYQNRSLYKFSEWRMLISLKATKNVTIKDLTLKSSGGDGIYIGGYKNKPCKNIVIDNVIATDHHRQGISVITVENLVIKNSKFINTSGTAPAAGIDFEPNNDTNSLSNILVENCIFDNNSGSGMEFHVAKLRAKSKDISITIKNCRSENNRRGFRIASNSLSPVKGFITFENCQFKGNRMGSAIENQRDDGMTIKLKDCILDNRNAKTSALSLNSRAACNTGNIIFENVNILLKGREAPIKFFGSSGYGITSMQGELKIAKGAGTNYKYQLPGFIKKHSPNPKLQNALSVLTPDLKKISPISQKAKIGGTKIRFRGRMKLLQYAGANENLTLKFRIDKIARYPFKSSIVVKDENNTTVDTFRSDKAKFSYTLKSKRQGVYTLEINPGRHTLSILNAYPGQAVIANNLKIFRGRNHHFYFNVPVDVENISILVNASAGEPVDAKLLKPNGQAVARLNRSEGRRVLSFKRPNSSKSEVWSVMFPNPREDFSFTINSPLLPLVATAPENLLIVKSVNKR
jgi:Right handed beta helix region